jgi:transcriptional regulator with XRE-family HTH domain
VNWSTTIFTNVNIREKIADLISRELGPEGNQGDLAIRIDISPAALSQYKHGKREPGNDELAKLANYFKVSTDWLLGRESDSLHESQRNLLIDDLAAEFERLQDQVKTVSVTIGRLREPNSAQAADKLILDATGKYPKKRRRSAARGRGVPESPRPPGTPSVSGGKQSSAAGDQ